MPRDARFWRNVAIITVAHLAIVLALARGGRDAERPNLETVVWMNSEAAAATEPKSTPAPTPREIEKPEEVKTAAVEKSEIQLPSPSPTPTVAPKPSPSPTPRSSPKPTEEECRAEGNADGITGKKEGRFGEEIRHAEERVECLIESKSRQDGEPRKRIGQQRGAAVGIRLVRDDAARPLPQSVGTTEEHRRYRREDVDDREDPNRKGRARLEVRDRETVGERRRR
jgi:outer membrane biosynthesis protein TonB